MNKENKFSLLVIFITVIVLCCFGREILGVLSLSNVMPGYQKSNCNSYLPPKDLRASDLAGTWVAGLLTKGTLILRQDNKYKQIIYGEKRNINYQTDWQDWRLERDNNGFAWLHLKGMRMCGVDSLSNCDDTNYN
jgi:hypothetical protein